MRNLPALVCTTYQNTYATKGRCHVALLDIQFFIRVHLTSDEAILLFIAISEARMDFATSTGEDLSAVIEVYCRKSFRSLFPAFFTPSQDFCQCSQ